MASIPETNKYSSWALRDVETVSLLADSGWGAIVFGDREDGNQGGLGGAGTRPKVALDLSKVFRTYQVLGWATHWVWAFPGLSPAILGLFSFSFKKI